jgi:hypothetical protein
MKASSRFARRVFFWAGIYGLIALFPLYFLEDRLGRAFPPPLTHPENYYGFIGVALAWQLAFLAISREPVRLRPIMIAAVAEKLLSATPNIVLFFASRVPATTAMFAAIDLALGAFFVLAFLSLPQRRYIVPFFGCAGEERIPFPDSGWRSG